MTSPGSSTRAIEEVRSRLRAEFLEMPGLRLKSEQVQRLCGVERTICQQVLDSLVDAKFLCVKSDGHYARLTDGKLPDRPRPAKVYLGIERRSVVRAS